MTDGNAEQIRTIIAEAVRQEREFQEKDSPKHPEIAVILKWVAGVAAVLVGAAVIAYFNWLTGSVNTMQVTLARMDERMAGQTTSQDGRFSDLDRRVSRLESFHQVGGAKQP